MDEDRIRASEERLQLALEGAKQGTWELDLQTQVVTWDDRCKAMFGLSADVQLTYAQRLEMLHPDDETLGCGGAISLLCRQDYDVSVLIVSDGTGSHPNSQKYPAPMLRWIRSQETLAALVILGVDRWAVTFLHLKDGDIPTVTAPKFHAAKVRCRHYLQATVPDTIFVPWRRDLHPDHRATWQLIQAAILSLEMTPQVIEYPIWDWDFN